MSEKSAIPLVLTASAIERVEQLIEQDANDALKLRVFVTGGGCSGFQYGFTMDELAAEDDTIIESDSATTLVDSISFPYLEGSTIDYVVDLQGSHFVVTDNPNAQTTCGCGISFST